MRGEIHSIGVSCDGRDVDLSVNRGLRLVPIFKM